MIVMVKQKQPHMPISIVTNITCKHGGCMITIGKIPQKVKTFFKPTKNNVSAHIYSYYCNLVIAICISHGSTIQRLVKLLRNSPHRTNHGEFLWRSQFGEMAVVRDQADGILKRLYRKGCKDCLLIIDDQRAQGDKNDTKDMLSLPPISQLKACMHQIIWNQEVQNVIKVSHDEKVIRRLEKLLAA